MWESLSIVVSPNLTKYKKVWECTSTKSCLSIRNSKELWETIQKYFISWKGKIKYERLCQKWREKYEKVPTIYLIYKGHCERTIFKREGERGCKGLLYKIISHGLIIFWIWFPC